MIARACAALCILIAAPSSALERFAIVIGNNAGSGARAKLWFAERDAQRFARTLSELGDVPAKRTILLQNRSIQEVRDAFAEVERQVRPVHEAGMRTLLVVYFSGHADSSGLQLGGEQLSYDDLRSLILRSSAHVKVAIIDACQAGMFTQLKGVRVAPVHFSFQIDEAVEGVAFVSSAAPGEAAQESGMLGASFFTHNLEMALRGAADADGDGQVTLSEAFRYASRRTLSETFGTDVGPQHPTYAIKMSGRGDVVLSDLRRGDAHLGLPAGPSAQYILRGPNGFIGEIQGSDTPLTLVLPAGAYSVERRLDGQRQAAEVVLNKGDQKLLPELKSMAFESVNRKGTSRSLEISVGASMATGALPNYGLGPGLRVGVGYEVTTWLLTRLRFDYSKKAVVGGALDYDFSSLGAELAGLIPLLRAPVQIEAGLEAGYAWQSQVLREDGSRYAVGAVNAGVAAAISLPVGPVRLRAEIDGQMQRFRLNNSVSIQPALSTAVLVSYVF
jgi:hypothetical protein